MIEEELRLPFVAGSDTSLQAARHMGAKPTRVTGDRQRILNVLLSGGKTDAEIQEILGLSGSTERPRRGELVQQGLVVDSGERRDRSSVWALATTQRGDN